MGTDFHTKNGANFCAKNIGSRGSNFCVCSKNGT